MTRQIPRRVIQMYKGPIDGRHTLEHILQTLAQIVAIPQRHLLVEDHVDLHVQLVARVIGLTALDTFDGAGEAHGHVEQDVAFVSRGGGTR